MAQKAGLTHGAVYRHFASKDQLVAAAIEADFGQIVDLLDQLRQQGKGIPAYAATYLQENHRDHFPWGCPAAPLAAEIMRTAPDVQAAFVKGVQKNLEAITRLLGGGDDAARDVRAKMILACLVGAMALARATKGADPALSADFLSAVRRELEMLS